MKKILVVDNDEFFLKFMKEALSGEGHEVLTAKEGLSALDILKTYSPDVVFIDLVMPHIDGRRLCRIVRRSEKLKGIYMVILSAIAAEDEIDLAELGADECIAKGPINEMAQHILAALERSDRLSPRKEPKKVAGIEKMYPREVTKELLTSKRHLEIILEGMSEGIVEITIEGRIVYANPASLSLIDIAEEDLVGDFFVELFAEEDQQRVEQVVKDLDEKPRAITGDSPVKLNDSLVSLSAVLVPGDRLTAVIILNDITKPKQAEYKLRKSEEAYRYLVENARDIIFKTDSNGRFIFFNPIAARTTGYPEQDLMGMHYLELIHPDRREDAKSFYESQYWKKVATTHYEYPILTNDGETVWLEQYAQLIVEGDRTMGFHGVARNITERKLVEEELRKLSQAVEQSANIVVITDLEGSIEYVNPKFVETTGYTKEEVLGENPRIMKSGEQSDEFYRQLWQTITSGKEWRGEFHNKRKDGTLYWEQASIAPVFDDAGRMIHFMAVKEDISDRKRTEEELKGYQENLENLVNERTTKLLMANEQLRNEIAERIRAEEELLKSKETLQTVFNGITDPLIMLDDDMCIKMLNRAAENYFRLSISDDIFSDYCFKTFRGKTEPCGGCNIPSKVSAGEAATFEREGFMNLDRIEEVSIYPLTETTGQERGAVMRIRDITESKLMERQLIQSEKLASLGLLVSGISHEINNPNNFIVLNIPILRDYLNEIMPIIDDHNKGEEDFHVFGMKYGEFRKDIFKLLENMEHGSSRINGIVSSLREFIKKRDRAAKRRVDLNEVIERSMAICRGEIKKRVKSFEMSIPDELSQVLAEPESLEQILINLLVNASHAADKEDSWIKLNVQQGDTWRDHMIIEVSDNGCGMDDETKKRIFDPFFTTKSSEGGTGLGLYVSYNLVEAMGARIEVDSSPGKGSTFRVILPDEGADHQRKIKGAQRRDT